MLRAFGRFFFTICLFSIYYLLTYIILAHKNFSVWFTTTNHELQSCVSSHIYILSKERNDSINKSIWCIASRRCLIIAFWINERKDYLFMHQYLFSTVHLLSQRYEIERKYLIFFSLSLPWLFLLARLSIDLP